MPGGGGAEVGSRAERPAGPGSGCPCSGGAEGRGGEEKMAADLEAEVQAIDKSLLECSAEEIAVVRRRARGGRARRGWGREGAGAGEAGGRHRPARPAVGP